jgi:hypothetical protein
LDLATAPSANVPPRVARHIAGAALGKSVLINMVAPALLYNWAQPHFPATSLVPLGISGLPPILWLLYSVVRLKAVDWLGLFAAENVAVAMVALLLAHTEREALMGRAAQNFLLALLFLGSLLVRKPIVQYMARQLATGNDPAKKAAFDAAADLPAAIRVYRAMTAVWAAALAVKAIGAFFLGAYLTTRGYLICLPIWDLVSDSCLVTWSLLYGRSRLKAAPLVRPEASGGAL